MINGYRHLPPSTTWKKNDVLVVFGEVFSRGYVNGVIEEAQKHGVKVIHSTVGRRDENGLRALSASEIQEKNQDPMINIPLEAGFDMTPDSEGVTVCDQLQGIKLKEWESTKLNWSSVERAIEESRKDFKNRLKDYFKEVEKYLHEDSQVVFVHTMAGGIPRAKIIMPLMNRIFKGFGDRYMSSEMFWSSELGKLCALSFEEVTAHTFQSLIEESEALRKKVESRGQSVTYQAYGYHGTEVLVKDQYQWQSYAPYLQGWAKVKLEDIAKSSWENGIKAQVFNAPEILTNSSSVFLGIEVALYPLLSALLNEGLPKNSPLLTEADQLLKPEHSLQEVLDLCQDFLADPSTQYLKDPGQWPAHNTPEQMQRMRETSQKIMDMHKDPKVLMTQSLSEMVFKACGQVMLSEAKAPTSPVWWIGHEVVAKCYLNK